MKFVYSLLLASLFLPKTVVGQDTVDAPNVPTAPDNLGDLCSGPDFCVQADRQACLAACEPGLCCSTEIADNCFDSNMLACSGYVACASLIGWGGALPCAGDGIASCSEDLSDPLNRQVCTDACAPATCCSAEGQGSCAAASPNACATYAACANLVPDGAPTEAPGPVPEAPDNIDDLCTDQDFCVQLNRQMCQAACAPASCCSAEEGPDNCLDDNLLACSGYVACQSLLGWGSLPCAGEEIESCSEDLSDPATRQMCMDACAPGACCFDRDEATNCVDESSEVCLTYFSCPNLFFPTNPPQSGPTETPVSAPTESPVSDPTEAPVSGPTESPVSDPTEAPVSDPTQAPVSDPTEAPVSNPTEAPVVGPPDVPPAPDNLGDLCTDQDFCVLVDRQMCQAACAPASCCSDDCLAGNVIACSGYSACQSLLGWGSLPCASEGIASCSEDLSDPDTRQACMVACAPAACCSAEGEDNCALESPNACGTYLTCANLLLPTQPPADTPTDSPTTPAPVVEPTGATPAPVIASTPEPTPEPSEASDDISAEPTASSGSSPLDLMFGTLVAAASFVYVNMI